MTGLYIPRAESERAHAGKASVLKSGIENAVRIRTPDSIHLGKGQDIYIPDVTEFWLKIFGELLDQYAEPIDFKVPSAADLDRIEEVDESK
jgi:alanine-alpha-ketoisovalerate/valine-pyruvate aminotransferase